MAYVVLNIDDDTEHESVLSQLDDNLCIPLQVEDPNGIVGCARSGIFAFHEPTGALWLSLNASLDPIQAVWQRQYYSIAPATGDTAGIVRLASIQETIDGEDDTIAVTPASLSGAFASGEAVDGIAAALQSQITTLNTQMGTVNTTLGAAVPAATGNTLAKRDSNGRMSVADGLSSGNVINKGQLDSATQALQTQITNLANTSFTSTDAATPNTVVRRDANARFKAADGVASSDVVTKAQLDTLGGTVTTINGLVSGASAVNSPGTLVKRDNNNNIEVGTASGANQAINKTTFDALATVVNGATVLGKLNAATDAATNDTLVKRNASTATISVGTATASAHAVRKDQLDAVSLTGTNNAAAIAAAASAATANVLMKRDGNGRAQVANGVAAADIVNKGQLDGIAASAVDPTVCQLRVSLTNADPWSVTDVTDGTTLYITPVFSGIIGIWNGAGTTLMKAVSGTISLAGKATGNYTIFAYDNNADNIVETYEMVAWTNDDTLGAETVVADGYAVKTGALSRRAIADVLVHATGKCDFRPARRGICHVDHRMCREYELVAAPTVDTWNAQNITTNYRRIAGGAVVGEHYVEFICRDNFRRSAADLAIAGDTGAGGGTAHYVPGIGVGKASDATAITANKAQSRVGLYTNRVDTAYVSAKWAGLIPGPGKIHINAIELNPTSRIFIAYGDNNSSGSYQTAMIARMTF